MPSATPYSKVALSPRGFLVDRWNRPVTSVRISLNPSSECNLRCFFCHKEGVQRGGESMRHEEIEKIVRVLRRFGVSHVKLTGGEPMLREDILEIVSKLRGVGVDNISMTTNGARLKLYAKELKEAGLDRVNISLHSLRPERYERITGVDMHGEVMEAVRVSIEAGLLPVKLNVVLMRGVNEDEVEDLIDFAAKLNERGEVVLQIIELVTAPNDPLGVYHLDLTGLELELERRSKLIVARDLHNRRKYLLENGAWVEIVKPMHNSLFCMGDNRMRITHDGKFKPCLMREECVDFLTPMRRGASDEELAELFKRAVERREPFFKPGAPGAHYVCSG